MQDYPGIAPLTVSVTPGAAVPGTIVSTGPSDPYGYFPVAQEVQDGDRRSEANYDAAVESLVDRTNWIAWRVPDWIRGGDYTPWTSSVTLGNQITVLQQFTAHAGAGQNAGKFIGVSGIIALDVESIGAYAGYFNVLSGDGTAVFGSGHGVGHGGLFEGGSGGHGVVGQAGSSSGTGVKGVATSGGLSLWGNGGPLYLDTNITASGTPAANEQYADQITKAWALITSDGSGGATVRQGVNITASVVTLGSNTYVKCQFKTNMGSAFYAVTFANVANPTSTNYDMPFVANGGADSVPAPTSSVFYVGGLSLGTDLSSWGQISFSSSFILNVHVDSIQ